MRRILAALLTSLANIALGVAITSWWLLHTVFDPGRTTDIAERVLAVEGVQEQLTESISDAVALQLGQDPDTVALLVEQAADTVSGVVLLSDVVVQSHAVLIGASEGPVEITPEMLAELLGDDRALLIPPIEIPVPTIEPLRAANDAVEGVPGPALATAAVLGVLAFLIHPRRDRMLTRWGVGLLFVAVAVMVVGYLLPVFVLPALTTTPWVQALPELARDEVGLLLGVSLVCVGAGLSFITAGGVMRRAHADRMAPATARPQPRVWG